MRMHQEDVSVHVHTHFLYINIWVLLFIEALLSQTGVSVDYNMHRYWILKSKVAAKRSQPKAVLKTSGVKKANVGV